MQRLIRTGAAVVLAAAGLAMAAQPSSAQEAPKTIIPCNAPVPVDDVSFPDPLGPGDDGIPFTGDPILGDGDGNNDGQTDVCAEMRRTIVFQGVADIDSGVNFAGSGDNVTSDDYTYEGLCVLVNWVNPDQSADPAVVGCGFEPATTFGTYGGPGAGQGNGLFNPIGAELEANSPGYTGLDWAPDNQASCFNSDGAGVSEFAAQGGSETWSATYTWNDSLDNLRGDITGDLGGNGLGTYLFDAKIEAQAWPAAVDPLDATAAGCLQKTLTALQNPAAYGGTAATGLNEILIVGTASWNVVIPEVLFP